MTEMRRLPESRQWELMFEDVVTVTGETKRQITELMKWSVGLQAGFIALVATRSSSSVLLWIAPLTIGIGSLLLHASLHAELKSHRYTLARIREEIGPPMSRIHEDHVREHIHGAGRSYRSTRAFGQASVIVIAMILATCFVAFSGN